MSYSLSHPFIIPKKQKFVRKEIHTFFNKLSFAHIAVFSSKEKKIEVFVSLKNDGISMNHDDLVITNYDVNNRCFRITGKNSDQVNSNEIHFSYTLDTKIFEPPYRLEIIHKKENENFENFKFNTWSTGPAKKDYRKNLFVRIGKIFPGPPYKQRN